MTKDHAVTELSDIHFDVSHDDDALAERVADWLLNIALDTDGPFALSLSGGSTPKRLYEHLAQGRYRDVFPWTRAHFFWGDERFVPPDDTQSNYRMVKEALLSRVPIPPANIHAVQTLNVSPEDSAKRYEDELRRFLSLAGRSQNARLFAATLLGLGEEGHFASLFPDTEALSERNRWAVAVEGVKAETRITLTLPALENSAHAAFLVTGEKKKDVLARFKARDPALPAVRFKPAGELWVFADEKAA
jgi:6-phosphogluconolactonase